MKLFAKTLQGLEPLLKEELEQFGGKNIVVQTRGLEFEGDEEALYRILINSTLALRVLLPIASTKIENEDELYDFVKTVDWHDHIGLKNTFAFDSVTFHEEMNHNVYLAQKSKDAIVDQYRETFEVRPNVDPKDPDVLINLHISREGECHLALDASGRSLNQRGYRVSGGDAPLNEVLAAGLIKLSGWDPETPFVDPMCGSGTLIIEAAFMAKNKPPGLVNEKFGLQKWAWFRKGLWTMLMDEAKSRLRKDIDWIEGSDISPKQVDVAKQNLRKARLTKNVRVRLKPFDNIWIPEKKGTIIINLPYGERIGEKEKLAGLYPQIAKKLKFKARGYKVCFFTGDPEFKNLISLTPDKITPMMNGTIPCEFLEYTISETDNQYFDTSSDRKPAFKKSFDKKSTGKKFSDPRSKGRSGDGKSSGRKPPRGRGFNLKDSGGGDLGAKRSTRGKPAEKRTGEKKLSGKPSEGRKYTARKSGEGYKGKKFQGKPVDEGSVERTYTGKKILKKRTPRKKKPDENKSEGSQD
ncbi:MAG: THUMP domain-containing protein [Balneolales bacterium]